MKITAIGSLLLIVPALALPAAAEDESVSAAQARSEAQLEASLAELATLRERVAAEKLPLAHRLDELE
jgi:hypothetical protein